LASGYSDLISEYRNEQEEPKEREEIMRGIEEILLINTTKYAELVMKISVLAAYFLKVSYSSNPNRREITTR
jgi:hypothetical protein